jgi:DNA-binding response OmpR family regulator
LNLAKVLLGSYHRILITSNGGHTQDVDLGVNSQNGHEVLKALRAQKFTGMVCIHSNRASPDDYKAAVDAGADAVLPKPMSRTHFLKLMLQAAQRKA